MTRLSKPAFILLLLAVTAAGCGDSNVIGPSNQPEVTNATDNFQLQASNLVDITQSLAYTWTNTGTQANIDQSGSLAGGTALLIVRDPSGNEVYRRSLSETGSFASSTGTAGAWRIELRLTRVTGALNFRVQKR